MWNILHCGRTPASNTVRMCDGAHIAVAAVLHKHTIADIMVITLPQLKIIVIRPVEQVTISCDSDHLVCHFWKHLLTVKSIVKLNLLS
jgi:hypothetical protein